MALRSLGRSGRAILPGQLAVAGTPLGLYPVRQADQIEVYLDHTVGAERIAA
jgi:hypothetical protein